LPLTQLSEAHHAGLREAARGAGVLP
jgi:hypothetical protein